MASSEYKTLAIRAESFEDFDAWRRELESVLKRRVYPTEALVFATRALRGHADRVVRQTLAREAERAS